MTHGNDLLQMRQILCAASINYHMWIFINFLSYVFCVKINISVLRKVKVMAYLLAKYD